MSEVRETARQRRRRVRAEEEQWAQEAYAEWLTTDEGGQRCYVLHIPVGFTGFTEAVGFCERCECVGAHATDCPDN